MANSYTFKHVKFDTETKKFNITKGNVGEYSYPEIMKASVVNEDANYTGKTDPFTHLVLADTLQPATLLPRSVYVGVKVVMKDGRKIYCYVSEEAHQINSLPFYDDVKEAKAIKEFVDKIVKKYSE